jgi:O-methyltransferase
MVSLVDRITLNAPLKLLRYKDQLYPSDFGKLYRQIGPYSMMTHGRLRGLYRAVREAAAKGIQGDIVECGSAKGGSAALMALTARQARINRKVWVFDTFEGLPPPTSLDDPDYHDAVALTGQCRGSMEEIESLFGRLEINNYQLVKGLVQDTLRDPPVRQIAVLHLDVDWYEAMKTCLDQLWGLVSPGGIVQIDDYGFWAGARKATNEFMDDDPSRARLTKVDAVACQLRKVQRLEATSMGA